MARRRPQDRRYGLDTLARRDQVFFWKNNRIQWRFLWTKICIFKYTYLLRLLKG